MSSGSSGGSPTPRSAPRARVAYRVEHLDGAAHEIAPEDVVRITEEPLLVRYR